MQDSFHDWLHPDLVREWSHLGYLSLPTLRKLAATGTSGAEDDSLLVSKALAFNSSHRSIKELKDASLAGSHEARILLELLKRHSGQCAKYEWLEENLHHGLHTQYWANQADYLSTKNEWFPFSLDGERIGYRMDWIRSALDESNHRWLRFKEGRLSDTAVLVGNGPSLRRVDFSILDGQEVFISNYAIKHTWLARIAKGVAVSNSWVAAQEPYWFNLAACWKFFPFWLGSSIQYTPDTVFLNAYGGEHYFSCDITKRISWHSTVSYFWLQILYSAGYRKVLMVGFDHSYEQPAELKEGDVIHQSAADPNHFDPGYFKGKRWQAADTAKMEAVYRLAKQHYENDGREIVNCTRGGHLELFRRSPLEREIPRKAPINSIPSNPTRSKSCLIPRLDLAGIKGSLRVGENLVPCGMHGAETTGREMIVMLCLEISGSCRITIGLFGETGEPLEDPSSHLSTDDPGRKWLFHKHTFASPHQKIQVSIDVSDSRNKDAIQCHAILACETVQSIFNQLATNEALLGEAHKLLESGDYVASSSLMLYLASVRDLRMYESSARMGLSLSGIRGEADQDMVMRTLGWCGDGL